MSVVETWSCEKMNKLVTCFFMESFKPSTVRHARRSTQEKQAADSQTDAENIHRQLEDAFKSVGLVACQFNLSSHSTYNITI